MNNFNRNKYAILILLLIPTIIWSLYSFKIHKNMFSTTSPDIIYSVDSVNSVDIQHWGKYSLLAHR